MGVLYVLLISQFLADCGLQPSASPSYTNWEWLLFLTLGDLPKPRIETLPPLHLQHKGGSLLLVLPGKFKRLKSGYFYMQKYISEYIMIIISCYCLGLQPVRKLGPLCQEF